MEFLALYCGLISGGVPIMRSVLNLFLLLTLASVLWRVLPHEWNMTPFMALALFAGARLPAGAWRYLLPLAGMVVSDLLIGLHATMIWVYAGLLAVVWLGSQLKSKSLPWYLGGAGVGALVFFVLTNFGVWVSTELYAPTLAGLVTCYVAALPFLAKSLAADLLFTTLFFIAFEMVGRRQPAAEAGA